MYVLMSAERFRFFIGLLGQSILAEANSASSQYHMSSKFLSQAELVSEQACGHVRSLLKSQSLTTDDWLVDRTLWSHRVTCGLNKRYIGGIFMPIHNAGKDILMSPYVLEEFIFFYSG